MSRAFTKERDDAPEPEPRSPGSQHHEITAAGLERLRARLAASIDPRERERLSARLDSAVVVTAPADRTTIAFGATVDVDDAGTLRTYTIVGEDEDDIPHGLIPFTSPLAQALLGSRKGRRVTWRRPAGDKKLIVKAVRYPES